SSSSLYATYRDLHSFPTRRSSDLRGRPSVRRESTDKEFSLPIFYSSGCSIEPSTPTNTGTVPGKGDLALERLLAYERLSSRGKRSEEHTSELQSRFDLVCRLLLEK